MPFDFASTFSRGGRELVDLLNHAVIGAQVDLLFVFLVEEYRQHPTEANALGIYDVFCTPHAQARISADAILPLASIHLEATIHALRANALQIDDARMHGRTIPATILPSKYIFDSLAVYVRKNSRGLRNLKRRYRPERTPRENLPRGRMTDGQRYFVDRIWVPRLRPMLIAAGFRRMTSTG